VAPIGPTRGREHPVANSDRALTSPTPHGEAADMTKPSVLLSLVTDENDYQREQASAAKAAASQAGFDLRVI